MLEQLTSREISEWLAYFEIKERRAKDRDRDAKMKAKTEAKKGGFKR